MQPPVVNEENTTDTPVVAKSAHSENWSKWLFLAPVCMVMVVLGASLTQLVSENSSESNDDDSNSDSSTIDDQGVKSDFELSEWQVNFASTSSDLPVCNAQTLGRLYYVEIDAEFQVCNEGGWQIIDLTGPQGKDGNSPLFVQSQSTQCSNGGTRIEIGIDADGGGTLEQEEIEISLDICNGDDSLDVQSGPAGEDGNDGENGQDGQNGQNGQNGSDGSNTAILTTAESVGANCAEGGIRIDAGIDDNGDGILQASEFDQTQFVCNGFNGSASPDTMLTRISAPPLSMGCTAMGRVVENGLDNGDGGGVVQNGVLEDGEVDYVATYCDRFVYERLTDDQRLIPYPITKGQVFIGSTMFFSGDDDTNGRELWAHDFDNSSSWMVADINPGSSDSSPDDFTVMGTRLYFTASDSASGNELWAHETTNATTWLVFDINPGGHSNPESLTVLNSSIYFIATDGQHGYRLWEHNTTNVSTANLSHVSFFKPGWTNVLCSFFSRIAVYGDYLYVTDVNGILHGYSPSNRSLWEVGPSGSPMTFDQAFSLQTVGDQIIIRTALTIDLSGRNSELWIYSPMNYSSWKLPITIMKNHVSESVDPSYIDNSQIYFWGGSVCDCLYIYDSSNSTLWPVYMTDNGTQLLNQRQIGFIGSMMFFSNNSGSGPLYVHNFANSSSWEVGKFTSIWDMKEYDSSIIFSGIDDNNEYEYWRLWVERESTFY